MIKPRKVIVTRYLAPYQGQPSRVQATTDLGSMTIDWSHKKEIKDNHIAAARAYAVAHGWSGSHRLVGGLMPNGKYFVFIVVPFSEFREEKIECLP